MTISLHQFLLDKKFPLATSIRALSENPKLAEVSLVEGHPGTWTFLVQDGALDLPPNEFSSVVPISKVDELTSALSLILGKPVASKLPFSKTQLNTWGNRIEGSLELKTDLHDNTCSLQIYNNFGPFDELSKLKKGKKLTIKRMKNAMTDMFSSPLQLRGYSRHYLHKFHYHGEVSDFHFCFNATEDKIGLYTDDRAFVLPRSSAISLTRLVVDPERGGSADVSIYLHFKIPSGEVGLEMLIGVMGKSDELQTFSKQLSELWQIPLDQVNDPALVTGLFKKTAP